MIKLSSEYQVRYDTIPAIGELIRSIDGYIVDDDISQRILQDLRMYKCYLENSLDKNEFEVV